MKCILPGCCVQFHGIYTLPVIARSFSQIELGEVLGPSSRFCPSSTSEHGQWWSMLISDSTYCALGSQLRLISDCSMMRLGLSALDIHPHCLHGAKMFFIHFCPKSGRSNAFSFSMKS